MFPIGFRVNSIGRVTRVTQKKCVLIQGTDKMRTQCDRCETLASASALL